MARKKRRKKKATTSTTKKRPRVKRQFVKPPGIRVEDLKDGEIIRYKECYGDDEEAKEELKKEAIHVILPSEYGAQSHRNTIKFTDEGYSHSMLHCHVAWDYKITRLSDYQLTVVFYNGEMGYKLTKKRASKNV